MHAVGTLPMPYYVCSEMSPCDKSLRQYAADMHSCMCAGVHQRDWGKFDTTGAHSGQSSTGENGEACGGGQPPAWLRQAAESRCAQGYVGWQAGPKLRKHAQAGHSLLYKSHSEFPTNNFGFVPLVL